MLSYRYLMRFVSYEIDACHPSPLGVRVKRVGQEEALFRLSAHALI